MQTPLHLNRGADRFAGNIDLRRALGARLDATLAGRRTVARILDDCPPLNALTLVVADLATAARAWAALLGAHGEPPDPARFDEPGLAQQFALGPCVLILFQPAEGTAADTFLCAHGDSLYAVTSPTDTATSYAPISSPDSLASLPFATAPLWND